MNNLDNLTVEEAIAVTKVLYDLDGVSVGVVLALVCTLLDMTSRKTEMSIEEVLALIAVTVLEKDAKEVKECTDTE